MRRLLAADQLDAVILNGSEPDLEEKPYQHICVVHRDQCTNYVAKQPDAGGQNELKCKPFRMATKGRPTSPPIRRSRADVPSSTSA